MPQDKNNYVAGVVDQLAKIAEESFDGMAKVTSAEAETPTVEQALDSMKKQGFTVVSTDAEMVKSFSETPAVIEDPNQTKEPIGSLEQGLAPAPPLGDVQEAVTGARHIDLLGALPVEEMIKKVKIEYYKSAKRLFGVSQKTFNSLKYYGKINAAGEVKDLPFIHIITIENIADVNIRTLK